MESDPPFENAYKALFDSFQADRSRCHAKKPASASAVDDAYDLPLIDLGLLTLSDREKEDCKRRIVDASTEWGFFQVKNHGVSREILDAIRREQLTLFRQPFQNKATASVLDFCPGCYRWGTPTATSLRQFSWSEAFHVPLVGPQAATDAGEFAALRSVARSLLSRLILARPFQEYGVILAVHPSYIASREMIGLEYQSVGSKCQRHRRLIIAFTLSRLPRRGKGNARRG